MVNNSRFRRFWSKSRWRTLVQLRIFYNSKFRLLEELAFKDELYSKVKIFPEI